jgi:hypothetical protein
MNWVSLGVFGTHKGCRYTRCGYIFVAPPLVGAKTMASNVCRTGNLIATFANGKTPDKLAGFLVA